MAVSLNISKPLPKGVSRTLLNKACQLTFDKVSESVSGTLDLAFVDKAKSRLINNNYAGNDYPTDVLSFDYRQAGGSPISDQLGEIIICVPIAQEQAQEHNLPLEAEVALLFIHGILHIIGYDHQGYVAQSRFGDLQDGIMEELALKSRQFKWSH